MRIASARLRALLIACSDTLRGGPRPASRPARPLQPRWRVGTLLAERDGEGEVCATLMVIGYASDGACLTVYVDPPPWLTPEQAGGIYRGARGLVPVLRAPRPAA